MSELSMQAVLVNMSNQLWFDGLQSIVIIALHCFVGLRRSANICKRVTKRY